VYPSTARCLPCSAVCPCADTGSVLRVGWGDEQVQLKVVELLGAAAANSETFSRRLVHQCLDGVRNCACVQPHRI
jgi:hypothetical protein